MSHQKDTVERSCWLGSSHGRSRLEQSTEGTGTSDEIMSNCDERDQAKKSVVSLAACLLATCACLLLALVACGCRLAGRWRADQSTGQGQTDR